MEDMEKRAVEEREKLQKTINYLKGKKRILFLTTSTRWIGQHETPKSTMLAEMMRKKFGKKARLIEVPKLKIYPCEGNVSVQGKNNCGVEGALLESKAKNPSRFHRCWASINNKDDELWKISRELFKSDCVVFFGSVRWGQTNSIYQKLIERLTWIENRHTTLEEENIVKEIDAGIILVGQNWNGKNVLSVEKQVLKFFGFKVIEDLCWNWQYTLDSNDERQKSYQKAAREFRETFIKK